MSNLTLVLLAAGNSSRFKFPCKKQWLWSGEFPLWIDVLQKFRKMGDFEKVVVVFAKDEVNIAKKYSQECEIAEGGKSREESLRKALKNIKSEYIMVSDIARSCPQPKVIKTLIKNKDKGDCIVPYIDVWDTVVYKNETLKREKVKLIQTPQLSRREILLKALQQNKNFTDERGAIESINGKIIYIKGDVRQRKITTVCDLKYITCLKPPRKKFFNGIGFDIHPFTDGKKMYLGGIEIECGYSLRGHSDADVLIHSIIDSLLGAANFGDIGEFFPDTSSKYKNIDSKILLKEIVSLLNKCGFTIENIDATIIAQKPKISPFKEKMKDNLKKIAKTKHINIKATTAEKLGFIGREEGIAVLSTATLSLFDWTEKLKEENEDTDC